MPLFLLDYLLNTVYWSIRYWLHFFICNRKPGDGLDNLETSDAKSPRENEHIIVLGYGQLYKMPIKSNEKWLSFQEVFQLLLIIQSEAIQLKGQEISEGMIFCYQNCSDVLWEKMFYWLRKLERLGIQTSSSFVKIW